MPDEEISTNLMASEYIFRLLHLLNLQMRNDRISSVLGATQKSKKTYLIHAI